MEKKLNTESFKVIRKENSEEENEKQWQNSKIVFKEFEKFLIKNEYKEEMVIDYVENSIYFFFRYFLTYTDHKSILSTNGTIIRKYLDNWYIRKNRNLSNKIIKKNLEMLKEFFRFIYKQNFITLEQFEEIKSVCNDYEWFKNRLATYKTARGEDFFNWIEEYNYEW